MALPKNRRLAAARKLKIADGVPTANRRSQAVSACPCAEYLTARAQTGWVPEANMKLSMPALVGRKSDGTQQLQPKWHPMFLFL